MSAPLALESVTVSVWLPSAFRTTASVCVTLKVPTPAVSSWVVVDRPLAAVVATEVRGRGHDAAVEVGHHRLGEQNMAGTVGVGLHRDGAPVGAGGGDGLVAPRAIVVGIRDRLGLAAVGVE